MDLSKYYAEICRTPLISVEEETALMERYFSKDVAPEEKAQIRDSVIKANMRCVFDLARKFSKNDPDTFADLIAAGNEGLAVGFDKYKMGKGSRVLTYCYHWIVQRIKAEMALMRIVHLPVHRQQLSARIQKVVAKNENASLDDIKKAFEEEDVSMRDVEELYKTQYLTFYIRDIDESAFEINPIEEEVQRQLDDENCLSKVNSLDSPYREIIARSFGLIDGECHSIPKISKDLKISKGEVSQMREKGLSMLRDLFLVT